MKKQTGWVFVIGAVLLIGSARASINTDYDHNVKFFKYKTYSWESFDTVAFTWDQAQFVKNTIDSQLAAKGWTQILSGGDIVVHAFGKIRPEETSETSAGFSACYWGLEDGATTAEATNTGLLVVEMYDNASKRMVWRGVATDTLSSKPERNTAKAADSVRKMFEQFPPESGKSNEAERKTHYEISISLPFASSHPGFCACATDGRMPSRRADFTPKQYLPKTRC